MQIILIRHSRTAGNGLRRYIGRIDEPLSTDGITLAEKAGRDFTLQKVYVTPLIRTQQTADILFPNAQQIVVENLREMDFGDFENRSADEMQDDMAYRAWVDGGCLAPCPNGEQRSEFSARVCDAFRNVIEYENKHGGEKIVFVVHGGTIMAILERFARPHRDFYSYSVHNCQGYLCQLCKAGSCEKIPFVLTEATLVREVTVL